MSGPRDEMRPRSLSVRSQLDELFRRESPRLLSFLRRSTGDPDAASDLLQESL